MNQLGKEEDPGPEYDPGGHWLHSWEYRKEKIPVGHKVQEEAHSFENVPARQIWQVIESGEE